MAKATTSGGKRVRVSQAMIDDIKRLGMTKALALAAKNKGATQDGKVAEFAEGVRRMYGERRYQQAVDPGLGKAKPRTPSFRAGAKMPAKGPMAKVASAAASKPTAAQLGYASARAGYPVKAMNPSPAKPKTAAQIAAAKKSAASRAAASKAMVKKAGGRTA